MYHGAQSVYLPEAPKSMASVTLWSQKGKSRKEHYICAIDHGVQVNLVTLPQKDQYKSNYTNGQKS